MWGLAYAVTCLAASAYALWRGSAAHKLLAVAAVTHLLALRGIKIVDERNTALWVAHDVAFILAALVIGRKFGSKVAYASAAAFVVVLQFDIAWLAGYGSFLPVAVVAETCGYLVFFMLAGATNGLSGIGGLGGFDRLPVTLRGVATWREMVAPARVHGNRVATISDRRQEIGGAR